MSASELQGPCVIVYFHARKATCLRCGFCRIYASAAELQWQARVHTCNPVVLAAYLACRGGQ